MRSDGICLAFGLGTMIYNGLEFGAFFETPFTSQCYMILRGVNPVLQMVFTFMQMYFIFMNSRVSNFQLGNAILVSFVIRLSKAKNTVCSFFFVQYT